MAIQLVTGDLSAGTNLTNQTDFALHLAKNAIDAHATMPACIVYNSGTQAIANDTDVNIGFDTEIYDPTNMHISGNAAAITFNEAGIYQLNASIEFDVNNIGWRLAGFKTNSGKVLGFTRMSAVSGIQTVMTISALYDAPAGDFALIFVHQTSGGGLNILPATSTNPFHCSFNAVRVG